MTKDFSRKKKELLDTYGIDLEHNRGLKVNSIADRRNHYRNRTPSFKQDYISTEKDVEEAFKKHWKGGVILDLGVSNGPHVEWYSDADKIIGVDIVDTSHSWLEAKYSNMTCPLTDGASLTGIEDNSGDFLFSVASIVRSPYEDYLNYFKEFKRVLKKEGFLFVHLPVIYPPCPQRDAHPQRAEWPTNCAYYFVEEELEDCFPWADIELFTPTSMWGGIVTGKVK